MSAPILVAGIALAASDPSSSSHPSDSWLIARSQALLDAVGSGDKKVFADTLAPSAVMADEEGKVRSAAELTESIGPLPPGLSGSIRIEHPLVRWTGDIAALSYDAAETEDVFGQTLHARYHTTDVYAQVAGQWRIVASQTAVLPNEAQALGPPGKLIDYVGSYGEGGRTLKIAIEDGFLVSRRGSGPAEPLRALGGDYFAKPGKPREQWIFVRDSSGHVTGLASRRENNDLVWERLPK